MHRKNIVKISIMNVKSIYKYFFLFFYLCMMVYIMIYNTAHWCWFVFVLLVFKFINVYNMLRKRRRRRKRKKIKIQKINLNLKLLMMIISIQKNVCNDSWKYIVEIRTNIYKHIKTIQLHCKHMVNLSIWVMKMVLL